MQSCMCRFTYSPPPGVGQYDPEMESIVSGVSLDNNALFPDATIPISQRSRGKQIVAGLGEKNKWLFRSGHGFDGGQRSRYDEDRSRTLPCLRR